MHISAAEPAFPPLPRAWYVVAFSSELVPGAVEQRTLGGEELVLFRTESGEPCLMGAYCPHLGAHFGFGGCVEGETLRCPFHAFRFDASGRCVSTPYGGRVPPKAKARVLPVREHGGVILGWYDPQGGAPDFEVPALDLRGWAPLRGNRYSLRGHPQETTENSVDIGHLSVVHGYSKVATVRAARTDGARLDARYSVRRFVGIGRHLGGLIESEFEIQVHGLGYSLVETRMPALDLSIRQVVSATPTEPGRIDLRIASTVQEPDVATRLGPLGRAVPRGVIADMVNRLIFPMFAHDVEQDFTIWQHKRYLHPPALAEGDGPVGLYRRWAAQFYERAAPRAPELPRVAGAQV